MTVPLCRGMIMKRKNSQSAVIQDNNTLGEVAATSVAVESSSVDLVTILAGLQTMRDGNFSVRLPGSWTGITGKLADTFNEIVTTNQQMAQELRRIGQAIGKEGRTRERTRFAQSKGSWGD